MLVKDDDDAGGENYAPPQSQVAAREEERIDTGTSSATKKVDLTTKSKKGGKGKQPKGEVKPRNRTRRPENFMTFKRLDVAMLNKLAAKAIKEGNPKQAEVIEEHIRKCEVWKKDFLRDIRHLKDKHLKVKLVEGGIQYAKEMKVVVEELIGRRSALKLDLPMIDSRLLMRTQKWC